MIQEKNNDSWKNKVVYEFNQTNCVYDKTRLIHNLFEVNVSKTPQNDALIYRGGTISYEQLNQSANKISHLLDKRKRSTELEPIVAIMIERTPEMIASILGVIKSGAAYLPIDTKWPQKRILEILTDAKVSTLITSSKFIRSANDILWNTEALTTIICADKIDENFEKVFSKDTKNLQNLWNFVADSTNLQDEGSGWINSLN